MALLKLINAFIRFALKACKLIALVTITGMCIVAVLQVASRVLPGMDPYSWTEEASLFLMVFMTFAVLPIASYRNLHTLLDMLLERMGALKYPTELFITVLCMLTSAACVYYGWLFFKSGSGTMATTLPWIDRGWIYVAIPVSFALMAIVYLQHLIGSVMRKAILRRGDEHRLALFDAAIRIDHL